MREIKFRGMTENGEWKYGLLTFMFGQYAIVNPEDENSVWLINKETVGQYTVLKDKNGVEIYEGDIVFDRWVNEYTPVFQNGIYMAYNPKNLMQNDPSTQFNIIWKDGCEVIGNIYENPELLETKKD